MSDLFDKHRARLERAAEVYRSREAWSPFVESPSRKHHPEGAHAAGKAAFEGRLRRPFELDISHVERVGGEVSPFTGEALGVDYPRAEVDALFDAVGHAGPAWRDASIETRVGVCAEMLDRWAAQSFENAYATMHTAGQAFMLAFAGSGASALDRGLEGLVAAWQAMDAMPRAATYARRFGRETVRLEKRYRLMPVGVAVVFACGSYPAWNAWPAVMANLATGNPVVLKPHPDTILPMAIGVQTGRAVLRAAGFDPNLLTLAVDTWEAPVGEALLARRETAIVDFTGGQRFGAWLEANSPGKQVYTETAGCNPVVLESTADLDAALDAVAHGLALFSGQMCTTPQNLWIPPTVDGVAAGEVVERLVERVDRLLAEPAHAAAICGALHSPRTQAEIDALTAEHPVVRASAPYAHPEFPAARTATPLLVEVDPEARAAAQRERFGPMAFVLKAPSRDAALAGAAEDARRFGAIASYAYTVDPEWEGAVIDAFARAGASVGVNLVRQRPIQFAAAFSDYHVTGLNPAGNACLTDPAFVSRRFRVVQSKVERSAG